jgi:hypothetical protein
MRHYSDKPFSYHDERVADTLIVKIEIESISGKQSFQN